MRRRHARINAHRRNLINLFVFVVVRPFVFRLRLIDQSVLGYEDFFVCFIQAYFIAVETMSFDNLKGLVLLVGLVCVFGIKFESVNRSVAILVRITDAPALLLIEVRF